LIYGLPDEPWLNQLSAEEYTDKFLLENKNGVVVGETIKVSIDYQ